jgi:hypothetical protein
MHARCSLDITTFIDLESTIFWDIRPCSPFKVNRRCGGIYRFHLQGPERSRARNQLCFPPAFPLVSCSAYSSTRKMEAICSSVTSVCFQRTTQCYISEDGTLHNYRCENLKSYFINFLNTRSEMRLDSPLD